MVKIFQILMFIFNEKISIKCLSKKLTISQTSNER